MTHDAATKNGYEVDHDEFSKTEKGEPGTPPQEEHIPMTFKRVVAIAALCMCMAT